MPSDRELDHLLDEALKSYSEGEPGDNLEQRILASVRMDVRGWRSTQVRWVAWGVAVLACGLLIAAIVLRDGNRRPVMEPGRIIAKQASPVNLTGLANSNKIAATPRALASHRPHAIPRPSPPVEASRGQQKLEVFPAPEPLSPEERAALALAKQGTLHEQGAIVLAEKLEIKPIRVSELHIQPLPPASAGEQK